MVQRIKYEVRTDKIGRKYGIKIILATNRQIRVPWKIAQKRKTANDSRRKREVIVKKLKDSGSGATYADYLKSLKIVEKETRKRYKKQGKTVSESRMRRTVKKIALEHRSGIASRYRYAWIYWLVADSYTDENGMQVVVKDQSPVFEAGSLKMDGDEMEGFKEVCDDVYQDVISQEIYYEIDDFGNKKYDVDGGACVMLYNKASRETIEKYELGKGCGYSLDLKSTNTESDDFYNSI
jgi:hypothetical protein